MNSIQKKLNKLVKYIFKENEHYVDFRLYLSYNSVRSTCREEFKKYTKEYILKTSLEELWDKFGGE